MTIDAVRDRSKTVTRRHVDTWKTLKPGDRLTLIEKGMGLKPGEKQVVICEVEVVDVRVVPFAPMTITEIEREGFDTDPLDGITPTDFYVIWLAAHGYPEAARMRGDRLQFEAEVTKCRRIEWRYLDEEPSDG